MLDNRSNEGMHMRQNHGGCDPRHRDNHMKDLQQFYMRLASNLERWWTSRKDKRHAAVLLRNHAIETPHCHFCGSEGELYDSRYNPKARICKHCALDIAAAFQRGSQPIEEAHTQGVRASRAGPR